MIGKFEVVKQEIKLTFHLFVRKYTFQVKLSKFKTKAALITVDGWAHEGKIQVWDKLDSAFPHWTQRNHNE